MVTATQSKRKLAMPHISVATYPDEHVTLEQNAQQKTVSVAWVMVNAAKQYIASKLPFFKGQA